LPRGVRLYLTDVGALAQVHVLVTGAPAAVTYTLSLHDALPISVCAAGTSERRLHRQWLPGLRRPRPRQAPLPRRRVLWLPQKTRSEEHTSELQSLAYLVCRLLLEKKNQSGQAPSRPALRRPHRA